MRLNGDGLTPYLGRDLATLQSLLRSDGYATLERLNAQSIQQRGMPLLDYLLVAHHRDGKGVVTMARELDVNREILQRAFELAGFPRMNTSELHRATWNRLSDDARRRHNEASVQSGRNAVKAGTGIHSLTHEDHVRYGKEGSIIGSSIGGQKGAQVLRATGRGIFAMTTEQRSAIGKRAVEQRTGIYAMPHAERVLISRRVGQRAAAEGIGFCGMTAEEHSEQGKQLFANKGGIHDPANIGHVLRTAAGQRRDLDFTTKSSWEANLARLLLHLGFRIEPQFEVRLRVDEQSRGLFSSEETVFAVDFRATSPSGRVYYYEIYGPMKYKTGVAKVRMFQEQRPEDRLVLVTAKKYRALTRAFAERIEKDTRFVGWETRRDNLKSNPKRYSR